MTEGSVTMQTSFSQSTLSSEQPEISHQNTCWEKFKKMTKLVYSYVSSILGLLFILIVYSLIGGFIFRAIEAPHEQIQKKNIIMERDDMIDILVNLTKVASGYNETNLTNTMSDLLTNYESEIYKAYKNGITTMSTEVKWDYWTALFYCGTVYTTIGYGHIAPATALGRVVTIIYATIGIPLALITLADLGKRFTFGIKFVLAFLRLLFNLKSCKKIHSMKTPDYNTEEARTDKVANGTEIRPGVKIYFGYEIDTEFNLSIYVALVVAVVYIFLGAGMYMLWEEWTYLEAVYFIFISISTIGFGDVIPAHPNFFLLAFVYIFIGLSLVSMCINVAMQFFTQQIDRAKVNIELAKEKAREKIHDVNRTITVKMHDMSSKKRHTDRNEPMGHSDEIVKSKTNGSLNLDAST